MQFDGGMIPVATLEPIEVPDGKKPELTPVRGLPKRRRVCRWEEAKVGLVQKPGEVGMLLSQSELPHRLAHNPRLRSLEPFSLLRRFTYVSAGHPIASRPPQHR